MSPQPRSMVDDPNFDWKKVKRRFFGIQEQLQKQADLLDDTRRAYLDDDGNPYEGNTKLVEGLELALGGLAATHAVVDDCIEALIRGDEG